MRHRAVSTTIHRGTFARACARAHACARAVRSPCSSRGESNAFLNVYTRLLIATVKRLRFAWGSKVRPEANHNIKSNIRLLIFFFVVASFFSIFATMVPVTCPVSPCDFSRIHWRSSRSKSLDRDANAETHARASNRSRILFNSTLERFFLSRFYLSLSRRASNFIFLFS